jgi:hypothetical protein
VSNLEVNEQGVITTPLEPNTTIGIEFGNHVVRVDVQSPVWGIAYYYQEPLKILVVLGVIHLDRPIGKELVRLAGEGIVDLIRRRFAREDDGPA